MHIRLYITCCTVLLLCMAQYSMAQKNTFTLGGKSLVETAEFYALFTPGFGVQGTYQFSKHGAVESGIYFINRGAEFEYTNQLNGAIVGNGFGTVNYAYIQIPLYLRYQFGRTYLATGLSMDFCLGTGTRISSGSGVGGVEIQKIGFYDASLLFSFGRDWKLNERLSLITEIRTNLQLTNEGLSNYGLGVGLNYKLQQKGLE